MLARWRPGGRIGWSSLPLHPVGIAAVPVLFLFAQNAEQQVTLAPLWAPLGLALAGSVAALLVFSVLFRDRLRGALAASLVLALFFTYGHAWNLLGSPTDGRGWLAVAYAALGVIGLVVIWRGRRWVRPATGFLNLAVTLLVAFNVVRIGDFALGSIGPDQPASVPPPIAIGQPARKPDIYYIILDRYAGPQTLERVYGYDNEPFLTALEDRGFAIARDAWANYFKTALSVASSLSMEYLDADALTADEPSSFGPVFGMLRGHLAVPETLKALGYDYVHLGNYWEPTATNVDADVSLRFQDASEFGAAVRSTTALSLLSPPQQPDDDPETAEFPELARDTTLYAFDRLEEAAGRAGPTFVFAHILVPHPPYVFDADGSMPTEQERRERPETAEYVHQLEWANGRVLQAIDHLLDVPSGQEPIIILQADEGPWPPAFSRDQKHFQWLDATPDEIAWKFGILNALYLPGTDAEAAGVTARLSPVNEFRVVFDAFFGADLPLLPDVTYLSPDYDHLYDFVPYTR
ncbi:MAG TPA: hypothetical protein VF013_05805 [Candidatus Limnocylindria bacterium]